MFIRKTRRESLGKAPSEHTEGVRLMRAISYHLVAVPELQWFFHVPNGGWRHKTVAAKLRGEGLKPGVADYCLPVPRGGYHGLFLELKAGKGRASDSQKDFADFVAAQGYKHVFVTGWEAAYQAVKDYMGIGVSQSGSSSPKRTKSCMAINSSSVP